LRSGLAAALLLSPCATRAHHRLAAAVPQSGLDPPPSRVRRARDSRDRPRQTRDRERRAHARRGPPRGVVQLIFARCRAALLAAMAVLVCGHIASAGVPSTTKGVEIVGERGTDVIGPVVDVLTKRLGLPLPANTRVHVYSTRETFRRGLVEDARMG